jgi:serine protease Do
LSGGGVKLAWVGGDGQAVTSDIASTLGLPHPEGVLIKSVYPGGPLASAGVKSGDVVLSVDGASVDDMQGLNYRTATHKPGDTVKLTLFSGGKQRGVEVKLSLPPENPPRNVTIIAGRNPVAGAKVENLSPAVASDLQMDLMAKGVVVTSVSDDSFADHYGFQPGDIIKSLNGHAIGSVADLTAGLSKAGGQWSMVVDRSGRRLTLNVQE